MNPSLKGRFSGHLMLKTQILDLENKKSMFLPRNAMLALY